MSTKLVATYHLAPKRGHAIRDCEDAVGFNRRRLRFAVADGATESFDSRRWARALTKAWALLPSINLGQKEIEGTITRLGMSLAKKWQTPDLPWYVQERTSEPAHAAFVGLTLEEEEDDQGPVYRWHGVALGDACLIVERFGRFESSFPIQTPDEFSYRPVLLPSRLPADTSMFMEQLKFQRGVLRQGDALLLCSDAIANWYLSQAASDTTLIEMFRSCICDSDPTRFKAFIDEQRSIKHLRNDDVAVVRIEALNR